MPLYEYRCGEGHVFERVLPIRSYLEPQFCECGEVGQKIILHAPRVFGDYEGYESPATGKWIEGRAARERDFRESGCRPYETGEAQESFKRIEENFDKQAEQLAEVAVEDALQILTN
jgi:hypothetical protein